MNKITAIIFDMDGVIADNNIFHKKAWKDFFKQYGINLSEKDLKEKIYGVTNKDIMKNFLGNLSESLLKKLIYKKDIFYRKMAKGKIVPVNGLLDFLNQAKAQKIKLAIATSAPPRGVSMVLSSTKTKKYFKTIVDDTDVTTGKPDPQIYLKAAKILKVNPQDCLVFEDSIPGIKAAKAAGMKVVGLSTTHSQKELLLHADMAIKDFTKADFEKLNKLFSNDNL